MARDGDEGNMGEQLKNFSYQDDLNNFMFMRELGVAAENGGGGVLA